MRKPGIHRQTLWLALTPILMMAILFGGYAIHARLDDAERELLQRAQILARSFAATSEYPMFSGNHVLLDQNAQAVLHNPEIDSVTVLDETQLRILYLSKDQDKHWGFLDKVGKERPLYQNKELILLYHPITATALDIGNDELGNEVRRTDAPLLGAVIIEVSKQKLRTRKTEMLTISLIVLFGVLLLSALAAMYAARRISRPIVRIGEDIQRIGSGELAVRIVDNFAVRELDNLARGINQMASELQQDRLLLESRIKEATCAMKEKKEEAERANEENHSLNIQLQAALHEVETIIEANPDILYVLNKDGELTKWNSHLKLFSGLTSAQLEHRHVGNFFAAEERVAVENWILQMLTHGAATIEADCIRHDGARVPYFCNGVVLHGQDGAIIGFTGTGRDITERRLAAERMRHMAHFDALTNLPNRALLTDRLQLALASAKRDKTQMALMFLDLDEFKPVNDRLGHHIGDILLKIAAKRMRDCVRQSDTVARIGGDEFVIMLPVIDKREGTLEVAEKIRLALCAPFDLGGEQVRISCSIGIALYPEHGMDEYELMRHADSAMYNAKQEGRNQTRWYEHDCRTTNNKKLRIRAAQSVRTASIK